MKRFIIAIILICMSVMMCIWGTVEAGDASSSTISEINELKEKIAQEDASASSLSYLAIDNWQKHHDILCLYMSHDRLGQIDDTLALIPVLVHYNDVSQACSLCDKACEQISELVESQQVSLGNIF